MSIRHVVRFENYGPIICGVCKNTFIGCKSKSRSVSRDGIIKCFPCAADKAQRDSENARLKRLYGITIEQYLTLVTLQNGCCKICGIKPSYKLAIDHNHTTRKIRGLICIPCNLALGNLQNKPSLCRLAAKYLAEADGES